MVEDRSATSQTTASRMMSILDVLSSANPVAFPDGMTAAEVSRSLHREKSVISRQMRRLLETGLIARDEDSGRYTLSWRLFALAVRAGDQRLVKHATPLMMRLTEAVRERTYLSVLSAGEVLTVHSESSKRSIEAVNWVGRTTPVDRTSAGMALLMDHDDQHIVDLLLYGDRDMTTRDARRYVDHVRQSRQRGYTVVNRMFDPELLGIAAPVRDFSGRIQAALNISGPASRIESHVHAFGAHLTACVGQLEATLYPSSGG